MSGNTFFKTMEQTNPISLRAMAIIENGKQAAERAVRNYQDKLFRERLAFSGLDWRKTTEMIYRQTLEPYLQEAAKLEMRRDAPSPIEVGKDEEIYPLFRENGKSFFIK